MAATATGLISGWEALPTLLWVTVGSVVLGLALARPTLALSARITDVATFGVVLGTLVLQGLTLRPFLLRVRLDDDGTVDSEVRLARVEALRAVLAATDAAKAAETAALVRHSYGVGLRRAENELRKGSHALYVSQPAAIASAFQRAAESL